MMKSSKVANLPSKFGLFKIKVYKIGQKEHCVVFRSDLDELISKGEAINVRIHSECLTGDAFGSMKCDCGEQLASALSYINKHGGALIYLRQEGRNIGLLNKINAYNLQDSGLNTIEANHQLGFEADERTYEAAEFILADLGILRINLLTNNPAKISALKSVQIESRIPIKMPENPYDKEYLRIKKEQMGHLL